MKITEKAIVITNAIKMAQKDKTLELEAILRLGVGRQLNKNDFNRIVRYVKGIPGIKMQSVSENMDIFVREEENLRYSILSSHAISQYCKSNTLANLNPATYNLIKKIPKQKIEIPNYNLRINLKKEEDMRIDKTIFNRWPQLKKMFRYKKRFSFITQDKLFLIDLTVVKTSQKNVKQLPNQRKKKSQINEVLKRFVVKPSTVKNFNEWWDSLKPTDMVTLKGRKVMDYGKFTNVKSSGVLTGDFEYEVEVEYIGNKKNYKSSHDELYKKFMSVVGVILQAYQNNQFVISNGERAMVKDELKLLTGVPFFSAPQNITLEKKHVVKRQYEDYENIVSIRRNYTVTDKADGERNLCVVTRDDRMFLINRKNEIKSMGATMPGYAGTILDGELVTKDKGNNNIYVFAVFDIYYLLGESVKNRILARTDVQKEEGKMDESRIEILIKLFDGLEIKSDSKESNLMVIRKKFYYGDVMGFDESVESEITRLKSELLSLDPDDKEASLIKKRIVEYESDTKIFEGINTIFATEHIYHTDGLVFTPINLIPGDEGDGRPVRFEGRWNKLFKWKPPEENTIDFLVSIMKDPDNEKEDKIQFTNIDGKVVSYKTLVLNVGYNPEIHTKFNSCRVMNEELMFSKEYTSVPFQPTNPYIRNIELAYIPVVSGNIYTDKKEIINNESMVEFAYDPKGGEGFCWKPLRLRDSKNDFTTATNVWRSIHNPLTKQMIESGDVTGSEEAYYNTEAQRSSKATKLMADFHSQVKKSTILDSSKGKDVLLDVSCGKAGDLHHWMQTKLERIIGVDVNRDNLENIRNGACNRILLNKTKNELNRNILLIWGDSSRLMSTGEAANDDLNKYYLDVLFGNVDKTVVKNSKLRRFYGLCKTGVDVVSCQFSFHYFFENMAKLDVFLRNVSDNLKDGGRFVGTCFDGKKIFNDLRDVTDVSYYDKTGKPVWKIEKRYEDTILTDDSRSLSLPIDVYVDSIGKVTTEWLVNWDYVAKKLPEYDLKLVKLTSFEDHFKRQTKNKMPKELQQFSFYNLSFEIEKDIKG